ncbi:MAG: hypothetical protein PF637_05175 [Spirochaetes bacterium]|nr:hypothetical protein [Spirochaetota bacterium]
MKYLAYVSFLLIFTIITSCSSGLIVGGSSTKTAIGSAQIINNNQNRAKQEAINNALHNIIKDSLKQEELLLKYRLVETIVPAEKSGMIISWSLEDEKDKDGFYFVKVRGKVNQEKVRSTITNTFLKYGSPRVAVVVKETIEENPSNPFDSMATAIILTLLKDAGIECVENSQLIALTDKEKKELSTIVGGKVGLTNQDFLNETLKADILVTGSVEISDQTEVLDDYNSKMKSKIALVNLRAIDTTTGRILAAASESGTGVHINDKLAHQNALKAALSHPSLLGAESIQAGRFIRNIITAYILTTVNREISVTTIGLDKKETQLFYDKLAEHIYGITPKDEPKPSNGSTTLTVQYTGESKRLASEIIDLNKKLGYNIKVESIKTREIIIRVTPAE